MALKAFPQSYSLKGNVRDENGAPLAYAPVVLLYPADSTLAFFGVTNEQGVFEIKGIRNDKYLLQVTLIGHQTVFREVTIPVEGSGNLGTIIMKSTPLSLGEVIISEEHIPIQFKRDTIEYNTAAYITKPDAVVEDLLNKLPGIDVDRAGNIKAMGEDVKKVLVDGREFFGSDPKLVTRNVPADALKKIQLFDKKSDQSEFTGIDDGTRDKTLNLLLKDNRKDAVFGELLAGAGNGGYYQGSGKAYRFSDKNQFAILGMANNINQFGFSFKDYIDFSGGLQSISGQSGAVQIKLSSGGESTFPVNFGQPVTGLSTSGAGGLNFSRVFKKDSRIFMSYIANGSDRNLFQTTSTRNYTESDFFQQEDSLKEKKYDRTHRFNFGLRNRIDSTQNVIINGVATLSSGRKRTNSGSVIFSNDFRQNRLASFRTDKASRFTGNINGSYQKLINRGRTVFSMGSDASYSHDLGNSMWTNNTYFFDPENSFISSQFQNNLAGLSEISANSSLTLKPGKAFYIEPEFRAGSETETLKRSQGNPSTQNSEIDSLSPGFSRQYLWFRPEIKLIRNTDKVQFMLGMQAEIGKTSNSLNGDDLVKTGHIYFTPNMSWEYEYKTGRRLRAYYQTVVKVPSVNQLLPVTDNSNPLEINTGNRDLKPELEYNLSLNWWIFDQFSFTSFLTGLNTTYSRNKINWERIIGDNLLQYMTLVNVSDDYKIQGTADFSTPVRGLGIKINSNIEETWNRGLSYINGRENINTNFSHRISLSIENRKKTKLDIIAGTAFQLTDTKFSIQESLNYRYYDFSWFTDLRYNPNKRLNFQFTTDVTNYNSRSFKKTIRIPLIGAEISYYILKNNRGTFTLQGSDLLNRNTGIERSSDFNYMRESRSNMLGRFFMLSFKYKLNKFGDGPGSIDIRVNKH
jgi:hypothetical protein